MATGAVQRFADLSSIFSANPTAVKTDLQNNVYVLSSDGTIRKYDPSGAGGEIAFQAGNVNTPRGPISVALTFFAGSIDDPDIDGDGVPNSHDPCNSVELVAAVDFGGCAPGVRNPVFASGCTTQDLLTQCYSNDGHEDFATCATRLAHRLKAAGAISAFQENRMEQCAAKIQ